MARPRRGLAPRRPLGLEERLHAVDSQEECKKLQRAWDSNFRVTSIRTESQKQGREGGLAKTAGRERQKPPGRTARAVRGRLRREVATACWPYTLPSPPVLTHLFSTTCPHSPVLAYTCPHPPDLTHLYSPNYPDSPVYINLS